MVGALERALCCRLILRAVLPGTGSTHFLQQPGEGALLPHFTEREVGTEGLKGRTLV